MSMTVNIRHIGYVLRHNLGHGENHVTGLPKLHYESWVEEEKGLFFMTFQTQNCDVLLL